MKWVTLAMAPDQLTAEMWCELLRNEGIPAMVQALGRGVVSRRFADGVSGGGAGGPARGGGGGPPEGDGRTR